MVEQCFNISATVRHAKNQHVLVVDGVNHDVFANGEAPRASTEVVTAGSAQMGVTGKKEEPVRNRVDQAVGNFKTAAFLGDVIPDIIEVAGGSRGNAL